MGHYFGTASEGLLFIALGAVQLWMARSAISFIVKHLSARYARVARYAVVVATAVVIFGLALHLPTANDVPLPAWFFGWFRGVVLIWGFASAPAWLVYRLLRFRKPRPEAVNPVRRALLAAAGGAAVAAPFALVGYGAVIERTKFQGREVDVPIPNLHPDLVGLRLLQLSDIHLSPFLSQTEFARAVDMANELRPHLVLVTGDLISVHGDPLDACLRQVARLRSDAGTLGCLGNHEMYAGVEDYTTEQGARLGIPFLRGRARQFRFGNAQINIAGADYQRMSWSDHYLEGAEQLLAPGSLNILLQHNPDVFPTAARQGWDLTLAGHTHGGQVNVEILHHNLNIARFYTPYVRGLYRSSGSAIYVTRGIGTIGMPARIGAPPEISLLRLRKA
jgi:predicted MPP superfamily phosphohydrolase